MDFISFLLYIYIVQIARKSIMSDLASPHSRRHFPDPDNHKSTGQLADEITQLAANLDAGTYQLLKLIGEFDNSRGWNGEGILSCVKIN